MSQQPTDQAVDALLGLVDLWRRTCTDFVALVRDLPASQWGVPTDLPGWTVKDVVAHVAHLEAVLAGAPEDTGPAPEAPHVRTPLGRYTEQGVLARRDRKPAELVEEIEWAVGERSEVLRAHPPADGSAPPPRAFAGLPWDTRTLLTNRPFDVWMHEQDIRRAVGRPGGYAAPGAAHAIDVLGAALPMVVGKRVSPPAGTTVRLAVPDAGRRWTVTVGQDGRAGRVGEDTAADATIVLGPQDFVVLAGGRRTPEATHPVLQGDTELGRRVLASLAVTP